MTDMMFTEAELLVRFERLVADLNEMEPWRHIRCHGELRTVGSGWYAAIFPDMPPGVVGDVWPEADGSATTVREALTLAVIAGEGLVSHLRNARRIALNPSGA